MPGDLCCFFGRRSCDTALRIVVGGTPPIPVSRVHRGAEDLDEDLDEDQPIHPVA